MFKSIYMVLFMGLASFISISSVTYADYSVPVSHTHNNREHNHQLPKEGVNHRHGIGQFGKAIQKQNKVIYSSTTSIPNKTTTYKPAKPTIQSSTTGHTHAGREHQHPLPNQGVFHRHGTNGATGQRVVRGQGNNTSTNVIYDDIQNAPTFNSSTNNSNNRSDVSINNERPRRSDRRRWSRTPGIAKFTKGSTRCDPNKTDCNVCAVNIQQQFQKAAAQQINWSRKSWNFAWPQAYPPKNVRPLDVFDGDPKYTLGIPDTHIQGFERTNSRQFPYAGSHSHKRKGGIFVIKQGAKGEQFLSSLHKTSGRHPSGVQVIGKYLI